MIRNLSGLGQLDCAVGGLQDFPGITLITIIVSQGQWFQFEYRDGQEQTSGIRSGPDYTTGLPGSDWQTFKEESGVNCSITPDGTITI